MATKKICLKTSYKVTTKTLDCDATSYINPFRLKIRKSLQNEKVTPKSGCKRLINAKVQTKSWNWLDVS